MQPDALALAFAHIAQEAGAAILAVRSSAIKTRQKDDGSPVTEADMAAEEIITKRLSGLLPDMPLISEEAASQPQVKDPNADFLLVDPLDGTREFVAGRAEFTVNIALVRRGRPWAGVVYAPALLDLYLGGERAFHARLAVSEPLLAENLFPIRARRPNVPPMLAVSRSHFDLETKGYVEQLGDCPRIDIGSSLKFGLIARGVADLYPRFSPTMEWDVAAGHAVLAAAGGSVTSPDGTPFPYGKSGQGYRNGGFVARGLPAG